jgi:outer membrane protein assembly factor BamB
VAADGDYPDSWSETRNVLWKVPLPGEGNSSPVVWADRIYLTAAEEGGRKRQILCLRRDDGRLLWRAAAPDAEPEEARAKNGHASATPCTDGERVYAYFGNHGLLCVDTGGKQVWHQRLGTIAPVYGSACSPLLYREEVIVCQDQRAGSFLAAFDRRTGKRLWRTPRTERRGWGSPVAVRVGEQDEIVVSGQFTVRAYDPGSGRELWRCGGNFPEVTPTPVAGHGLIFCCSGQAGPTLAIRPQGAAGDITKTHLVWKMPRGSPYVPSPLLYGDYLYLINDSGGVATCLQAGTGKVLWRERLGAGGELGFSASPVGVNGKVFFTSDAGETYVLAAGPEFRLLGVNRLPERTLASPALVDGRWYVRTEHHLYCIGKKE